MDSDLPRIFRMFRQCLEHSTRLVVASILPMGGSVYSKARARVLVVLTGAA
jgi:hypothetical protein